MVLWNLYLSQDKVWVNFLINIYAILFASSFLFLGNIFHCKKGTLSGDD